MRVDLRRWAEVRATFDTLVELDDVGRASRLALLGSSDPDLHAAVKALFAADAEVDARLASLDEASSAGRDPLGLAGRTIADFEVREPIGAGGMGVVYRAADTRLGRDVALKFLLPTYSRDGAARARFLREAHSAATLDHPNLCTVYEVGASDDGWLFIAMALYRGETLRARLTRDRAIPVRDAVEIARQAAEGVQAAHAAGIVHRDLKPGNVMLLPDGTVRILDFGLAKVQDESLSETGGRLGTVAYMSPEQFRGRRVDGRADLWALGVMLYEMLTGRKPFGGAEEVAIAQAVLHDRPVPPSTYRADIPVALEDLVLRLLRKDPTRRYSTAAGLSSDLSRIATMDAATGRWRRRLRRARHILLAGGRSTLAGTAAVAIGMGLYAAVTLRGPTGAPTGDRAAIAVLPFRNLSADSSHAYLAEGLQDEILTQLYKVPALRVIGRNSVMGYRGAKAPALRQLARELAVGSVVDASVQVVGRRLRVRVQLIDPQTGAQRWAEQYDRAVEDVLALQSEVSQHIANAVGAQLTNAEGQVVAEPTRSREAYLYYLQALDYVRAPWDRRSLEAADQLLTKALSLDTSFALAYAARSEMHGHFYFFRHDMRQARLARERADALAALRLAPDLPAAHRAMALYHQTARTDPRLFLEEIRVAVRGAPNDANMWERLAGAHRRLGNFDSSLAAFDKALQLSPRDVHLIDNHGVWTNQQLRRFDEVIRWCDYIISLWPDLHFAKIKRAWAYAAWQGQLDTLRAAMRAAPEREILDQGLVVFALEFLRTTHQPDSLLRTLEAVNIRVFEHPFHFIPASLYAAWAHELRGDRRAARVAYDSARVFLDSAVRRVPDDWAVHHSRGMALAGLGRRQDALREVRWLRESVIYREDAFFGPTLALAMAEILAHSGEPVAAVEELERVLEGGAFGNILQIGITAHSLRLDPTWDRIREHPRFKALLARHGRAS